MALSSLGHRVDVPPRRGTMTVVTPLSFGRPLTWHDLQHLPDDGHRYELIDGSLID